MKLILKLTNFLFLLIIFQNLFSFDSKNLRVIFYVGFEGNDNGYGQKYIYQNVFRNKGSLITTPFKYEKGVVGEAAYFSWDDGYPGLVYPAGGNFNEEKGSISLWIKKTQDFFINPYYPNIWVVLGRENFQGGIAIIPINDKRLSVIEDGKWHHLVYTWDSTTKKRCQYCDGELIAEGSFVPLQKITDITFGYRLPGFMDELVILDTVLNSEDVKKIYQIYKEGKQPFILPEPEENLFPIDISIKSPLRPSLPENIDWELKQPVFDNGKRVIYDLSGIWRFQPVEFIFDGKELKNRGEPGEEWAYIKVPGKWLPGFFMDKDGKNLNAWKGKSIDKYKGAWYERDLFIPDKYKGGSVFLKLNGILTTAKWHSIGNESSVYINQKYIGRILQGEEKYFDLTSYILFGKTNRISILNSIPFCELTTAGIIETPFLEIRQTNEIFVGEPLINSSVRNKSLNVEIPIKNLTKNEFSISILPKIYDYKTNELIEILQPVNVKLEKNFDGEKNIIFKVEKLKVWNPDEPQLYNVVFEISKDKNLIDITSPKTFGFREIWVENGSIYLNGQKLSIRGKSHNYLSGYGFNRDEIRMLKETGQNADRTISPQLEQLKTLKITDEEGWLVFYNNIPSKTGLKLIGNHPSVIGWQISGDGYVNGPHGHPMQIGGIIPDKIKNEEDAYKKVYELKKIDPTRLYFYYRLGVGGDFRSIMHYMGFGVPVQDMEEWVSFWAKHKQEPLIPCEISLMVLPFEAQLWQKGSKEVILLEQCAKYFGESVYERLNEELVETYNQPDFGLNKWLTSEFKYNLKEFVYKRVLRSWRTYGINGYLLHVDGKVSETHTGGKLNRLGECLKTNNSSFLFYISGQKDDFVNKDHNYFSEEDVEKSFVFVNDYFVKLKCELSWKIKDDDNKEILGGNEKVEINPGEIKFVPVKFKSPNVKKRTKFYIEANIKNEKGEIIGEDKFSITVFPKLSFSWDKQKTIALIDSTGETSEILQKIGIPYRLVNEETIDMGLASLSKFSLLIIGKNSYPEAVKIFTKYLSIEGAIKEGLNVICFEQRNRYVGGLKLENFNSREVFIRAKDSSLFEGLENEDFSNWKGESRMLPSYLSWSEETDWREDNFSKHGQLNSSGQRRFWHWSNKNMVATFCFEKPQLGNFRVLLENGFDLLYTPMIEFYYGKGKILFSQLDIIDHYGIEPVATILFHRILEKYSNSEKNEFMIFSYIGGEKGKKILDELKVHYKEGFETGIVFLSLEEIGTYLTSEKIKNYLENGGTLIVNIKQQKEADLLPVKIKLEKKKYFKSSVPKNKIFTGIGMSDLFFRKILELSVISEIDGKIPESEVIGEISYGKGRIIYIQLETSLFENQWQKSKILRIYNTIFTNLRVRNKVEIDIKVIGGIGLPEEWLPGYKVKETKIPLLKESNLYQKDALDFDPEQHHVW